MKDSNAPAAIPDIRAKYPQFPPWTSTRKTQFFIELLLYLRRSHALVIVFKAVSLPIDISVPGKLLAMDRGIKMISIFDIYFDNSFTRKRASSSQEL